MLKGVMYLDAEDAEDAEDEAGYECFEMLGPDESRSISWEECRAYINSRGVKCYGRN